MRERVAAVDCWWARAREKMRAVNIVVGNGSCTVEWRSGLFQDCRFRKAGERSLARPAWHGCVSRFTIATDFILDFLLSYPLGQFTIRY